jgi:antibiotic biosynthesis monooxygenase (ABM) superfamily enzyme
MMSLITHHLNPEGEARFSGWFSRLQAVLVTQPGFVSVRAFSDGADKRNAAVRALWKNYAIRFAEKHECAADR